MVKFTFTLHHTVKFGESVVVSGDCAELGNWDPQRALELHYSKDSWEGSVNIDVSKLEVEDGKRILPYKYVTVNDRGDVLGWEDDGDRVVAIDDWMTTFAVSDAGWTLSRTCDDITQSSSAFLDAIRRRPSRDRSARSALPSRRNSLTSDTKPSFRAGASADVAQIMFEVEGLRLPSSAKVGIVGSHPALGAWNPANAVMMYDGEFPKFSRAIDVSIGHDEDFPIKYKYVIFAQDNSVVYEEGLDRVIPFAHAPVVWRHDGGFRYPPTFTPAHWRGAGIAVPVFSLRSARGCGVGEFLDLIPLVDWVKKSGMRLIQVLPVNDSTIYGMWWDSYPYSPMSSVALHPMYLTLDDFTGLSTRTLETIRQGKARLNAEANVNYEEVVKFKWEVCNMLFEEKWEETLTADKEFTEFFQKNYKWLVPYAVFCNLRYQLKTPDFTQWGKYARPSSRDIVSLALGLGTEDKKGLGKDPAQGLDQDLIAQLETLSFSQRSNGWPGLVKDAARHTRDVQLQYFMQYHLHRQLKRASLYASRHGVALKGDVTIGVNPMSVDCWVSPHLFNQDCETGAPPDAFSATGQNWGFPTYNWDAMEKEDYGWWRQRLSRLAEYFQVVRLDHVIGFFRIWEIPKAQSLAMVGRFSPCIPVHRSELESVGLWDIQRLAEPYIRHHLLMAWFHTAGVVAEVKRLFLREYVPDHYALRDEVKTMVGIKARLAALPDDAVLLKGWTTNNPSELTDIFASIVSNVCFTRDKRNPANCFHARLGCQDLSTYRELEGWQKHHIDRLHVSYLYHRQDDEWSKTVRPKLRMLREASNMLICGEDLGMIPECVEGILHHEAILGVRLPRMAKATDAKLDHPRTFPYLVVASPSCHDMPTMRHWWETDRDLAQQYYNAILGWQGEAPARYSPSIATAVNRQLAEAAPMLVVYPLAELLAMKEELVSYPASEEEINRPSVQRWYWRFRLHTTLEDLTDKHGDLSNAIYDMLLKSNRIME